MWIDGFEYPPQRYYLLMHDMWVQLLPNGWARVGITPFGVHLSGHFFMCRPKAKGTLVLQGQSMAVAELNKTVVTIKSPISGQIQAINPELEHHPEIIQLDPLGQGWLVDLSPTQWEQDLAQLAHGESLQAQAQERMALEPQRSGEAP